MSTLSLTSVAIAPASDLSDVTLIGQYAQTSDIVTESRPVRFAGGRDRLVTSPGSADVVTVSFRHIERSVYTELSALVGIVVLFRDQWGRQVWGVLGNLTSTEGQVRDLLENITFTITSVTVSEVV